MSWLFPVFNAAALSFQDSIQQIEAKSFLQNMMTTVFE